MTWANIGASPGCSGDEEMEIQSMMPDRLQSCSDWSWHRPSSSVALMSWRWYPQAHHKNRTIHPKGRCVCALFGAVHRLAVLSYGQQDDDHRVNLSCHKYSLGQQRCSPPTHPVTTCDRKTYSRWHERPQREAIWPRTHHRLAKKH